MSIATLLTKLPKPLLIVLGLKADGPIDDEVKVIPSIVVTEPRQQPVAHDLAVLAVLEAEATRLK